MNADTPAERVTPFWLTVTIAVIFGLFYAYDAWEAVGNLVGLNLQAQSLDTRLSGFGWGVLIGGIALPIVVYAVAFWLGHKRSATVQALLLLAGLALVAVLALDMFVVFGLGRLIV
ncbi:hypothetical protein [Cryobacterium tepidiphilum]|uniref:Uncharacterized protein n=1 Tax=Cryobacterium tepidiphilum TaxID=2486026 RepID=A0A3M8L3J3_9MICO|nr:hypothetical protein [Cryobacterium tepidiphilum]RNE59302.1 hypothetical protein EEJ31_10395 [Cryobacterium tepidiphilum]